MEDYGSFKQTNGLNRNNRPLTRDHVGKRDFASSASSLPPMGASQSNFGATTRIGGSIVGATSSVREQILAEAQQTQPPEEEDQVLDIINKVQMFQIAVNKINKPMGGKDNEAIFKLAPKTKNGQPNLPNFRKHFLKDYKS